MNQFFSGSVVIEVKRRIIPTLCWHSLKSQLSLSSGLLPGKFVHDLTGLYTEQYSV